MSSISINAVAQAADLTQAAAETQTNWLLIGIIIGVIVILAIVFLLPSRKVKEIEDAEKKKELDSDSEKKALEDKSKSEMTLSEVKESKKAVVEGKTKEELRELRREKSAASQTEKAKQERGSAASAEASDSADKSESAVDVEKSDTENTAAEAENVDAVKAVEQEEDANKLLAQADADTSDVFASLFGGGNGLKFDDDLGGSPSGDFDGPIIPTLGSALISLDALTRAAEAEKAASGDKGDDEFAGLSMLSFSADSSEKKTLN